MSFFKNILGGSQSKNCQANFWKHIENQQDLEGTLAQSFNKKIVIFKHSTRCMISKAVLRNLEAEIQNMHPDAEFYFLDLIAHRDISTKIAEDLKVTHQSPQMIVIKDGKAIANASHEVINAAKI